MPWEVGTRVGGSWKTNGYPYSLPVSNPKISVYPNVFIYGFLSLSDPKTIVRTRNFRNGGYTESAEMR